MVLDKGVLRRYVPGLVLHTIPSYRRYGPLGKGVQALPGVMARKAPSDQDTGATALRQALAVLTRSQTALPRILDAEAMLLQAQEHLPAQCVRPMDVEDPDVLLGQCLPWLCQGGVIALQWQPLKAVGQLPSSSRWTLAVGGEWSWCVPFCCTDTPSPAALLLLDAAHAATWGTGHNVHLSPGRGCDLERQHWPAATGPMWTARSQEGGVELGITTAAIAMRSPDK